MTDNEMREHMLAVLERCRCCDNYREGGMFGSTCSVWTRNEVWTANNRRISLPRTAHITDDPSLAIVYGVTRELVAEAAHGAALRPPCKDYERRSY